MGKKPNKWKNKIDRLRLAAGWGRGARLKPAVKAEPQLVLVAGRGIKRGEMFFNIPRLDEAYSEAKPGKVFDNAWSFGQALEKRGYEELGSGCFSTVYAKGDSDRVLKVTRNIDNWIDYIHWASEKGYAGKFAPKVYSYKKFTAKDGEQFSVAVVERMHKGFYSVGIEEDAHIASALMWPCVRGNTMAQLYLEDFSPGLPKFLLDFHEEFGEDRTDIGGNNMMVRKDGSFCLTDPLAGRSKLTVKRLRSRDFTSLGLSLRNCNAVILRRTY